MPDYDNLTDRDLAGLFCQPPCGEFCQFCNCAFLPGEKRYRLVRDGSEITAISGLHAHHDLCIDRIRYDRPWEGRGFGG